MNRKAYFMIYFFTAIFFFSLSDATLADDVRVSEVRSLSAKCFDKILPDQPVGEWLRGHLPAEYEAVWGEFMTDCGESTGSETDKERDMPLCAEIEIKKGTQLAGYLALFVGTQAHGLLKDTAGVYFGYLEHQGRKYTFRKLSDILTVE